MATHCLNLLAARHACLSPCVSPCVLPCVLPCVCHACRHACCHACCHACRHACRHGCRHACRHACYRAEYLMKRHPFITVYRGGGRLSTHIQQISFHHSWAATQTIYKKGKTGNSTLENCCIDSTNRSHNESPQIAQKSPLSDAFLFTYIHPKRKSHNKFSQMSRQRGDRSPLQDNLNHPVWEKLIICPGN